MASKTVQRIEALARVSRDVLSLHFSPDCCVAATRAGLDVLAGWGVEATPALVRACAVNQAWLNGSRELGVAAIVLIDCETSNDGKVAGHLVITTRKYLLDLSAWQFDRPTKGIRVASGLAVTASGRSLRASLRGGGAVMYGPHPHPDKVSWENAPDWALADERHQQQHRLVVQELRSAAELAADRRTSCRT